MDIMKILQDSLNDQNTISKLSGVEGADTDKVKKATNLVVPAMLKALERNSRDEDGARSLDQALEEHKGSSLIDVNEILDKANQTKGDKAVSHMFGNNRSRVENNIAKETGLDSSQISNIMKQLAPVVLGMISQKKGNTGSSGLSSLIGGVLSDSGGLMSMASSLLDKDGDGSIANEIGGMLGGLFKGK